MNRQQIIIVACVAAFVALAILAFSLYRCMKGTGVRSSALKDLGGCYVKHSNQASEASRRGNTIFVMTHESAGRVAIGGKYSESSDQHVRSIHWRIFNRLGILEQPIGDRYLNVNGLSVLNPRPNLALLYCGFQGVSSRLGSDVDAANTSNAAIVRGPREELQQLCYLRLRPCLRKIFQEVKSGRDLPRNSVLCIPLISYEQYGNAITGIDFPASAYATAFARAFAHEARLITEGSGSLPQALGVSEVRIMCDTVGQRRAMTSAFSAIPQHILTPELVNGLNAGAALGLSERPERLDGADASQVGESAQRRH